MKITKNLNTKNPFKLVGWFVFGILSAVSIFLSAISMIDPSNPFSPAGIIDTLRGVIWSGKMSDGLALIQLTSCLMITFTVLVIYYYFGSEIYNEPKNKSKVPLWAWFSTKALLVFALLPFGAFFVFWMLIYLMFSALES